MATPGFFQAMGKERARNKKRFDEIDQTLKALEEERNAIADREKSLEAVSELYLRSQDAIESAHREQDRLTPRAADTGSGDTSFEDRLSVDINAADLVESLNQRRGNQ